MSDETEDSQERREAEALARALEGDTTSEAPPDALEVAALLRYAKGQTLPNDRQLERTREAALVVPIARIWRKRVLQVTALGSVAAAAALAFLTVAHEPAPSQRIVTTPRATQRSVALSSLLRAQAAALADPALDLKALSLATDVRRAELLYDVESRLRGLP